MQVHTFIADSASEAVARIRAELGPTAVVLSVRKLPRTGLERFVKSDQIEVLAGVEEAAPAQAEPAPAPPPVDPLAELRAEIQQLRQDFASRPAPPVAEPQKAPDRKTGIGHILTQTGLLPAYSELVVQGMPGCESEPMGEQIRFASDILRGYWRETPDAEEAGVHVFVGVPGSGKSTALCKMLAQTSLVQGLPSMVFQLDSHVANPSPQPAVYAEIVGAQFERNVPLEFERREESIFVDLPGVALNNQKGLEAVQNIVRSFGRAQVHLVLNGAYETQHLLDQVRFFSSLEIADLIISHLDEESRWGKIWNLVIGTNFSVRAFGTGQNIPGDFHPAKPEVVLERQFRGK